MQILDAFGNEITSRVRFFGGSPKIPKQQPVVIPKTPEVAIPEPIPAPDPLPPTPTTSNIDVQRAQDDQRKQASKRKGQRATLLAGETAPALTAPATTGPKTLLG